MYFYTFEFDGCITYSVSLLQLNLFQVTGEGSNRQREKIQRQREAVPITEVGSQCKLTFKMPGLLTSAKTSN